MTSTSYPEKRRFSRIPFDADAHIYTPSGDLHLHSPVVDISLNGLLIIKPENWQAKKGSPFNIDISLDASDITIKMQCLTAHIDEHHIGFSCQQLDLDSMIHLRRLISLNLGNDTMLERELSALIDH